MSSELILRKAEESEMEWINAQYDTVGFKHSTFENELIVIAELNGSKAGLGRLQRIEDGTAELGGIFVSEKFRGCGIAGEIVEFLLENSLEYKTVYCIPFVHLEKFYRKFGFQPQSCCSTAPKAVSEKLCWCADTYECGTTLLVKKQ